MRKKEHNNQLFSKALFKQSLKANYMMWLIITFAVCFMLSTVMLISGGSNIGKIKDNVQETIIESVIESEVKKSSINLHDPVNKAELIFDTSFATKFGELNTQDNFMIVATTPEEQRAAKIQELYVAPSYQAAVATISGIFPDEGETAAVYGAMMVTINPNHAADEQYTQCGEPIPEEYITNFSSYITNDIMSWSGGAGGTSLIGYVLSQERDSFRIQRAYSGVSMVVAANLNAPETRAKMLEELEDYGVTEEKYNKMGFDYARVHKISYEAMLEFQNKLEYEYSLIPEDIKSDPEAYEIKKKEIHDILFQDVAGTLLDKLPENVSQGLKDIGELDLYALLICSVFFKMAGLLLPIIYVIMVSNNLIAGQVDTGSMAYVLSTSTRRRQVTFTQALFLVGSLVVMFTLTTITGLICLPFVNVVTGLNATKLVLSNLMALVVMFAIAGINYISSCYFDRSKRAMAIGGGLSMFFLVATMLGLFGSPVIPSVIRIDALNFFNYVSIITLFDVISILDGTWMWIWKMAILLILGCACFFLGARKFKKKDLPL